ncbi:MAG: hypothetical protein U1D97_01600, partial [Desulfuromonadales bacterium]|nr:hypothetical protein [Desulfuromonadales bacterium]
MFHHEGHEGHEGLQEKETESPAFDILQLFFVSFVSFVIEKNIFHLSQLETKSFIMKKLQYSLH